MKQLVIGAGEVGTALAKVLGCPVRDIESDITGQFDVLHITFGWHDGFEETVGNYLREYDADTVIVHSTVPVGTCDDEGWIHSPVRGRHPNLEDGIRAFPKHVGNDPDDIAGRIFRKAGLSVIRHKKAATTELGKLLELAQFGVEVTMMYKAKELADQCDVPFEEVYTQFGRSYNYGYDLLGFGKFHKPVLDYSPPPIGAHCVSPGIELLDHDWFDNATDGYRSDARAKGVAS